jgi:DNA polymerase III delta subunit
LLTLASPSLFGEPRLIRVSNVEKCSDTFLTEAIDYLQNPADDTYVVLRHGGGVRGKKLLDTIRSGVGGAIEVVCAELKKDAEKHEFATAEFRTAGKRVTPSALRSLVAAFSDDLAELSAACQQLIADTGSEVTETTVDRYYGGRVETNAFKVADSAIAGRLGEALVTLRHALASGADPVPIVAAFASKIRTMAKLFGVRGKKLLDTIRSGVGGAVEVVCAELKKDSDKHDFATAEFRAAGKRVTPSALRSLVAAFSDDLAELSAACQQLIADTGAEVTETTVDRYYGGRVETNAFKVADSAIAGRLGEALVTLRHALSSGADPVPIVAAFASKIRTMAKLFGVRGGSAQLAATFSLAPWQVERAQRDLRGWTDEGLARCIVMLAETDAAVKGAGRDPVFALERLVTVIAKRGE